MNDGDLASEAPEHLAKLKPDVASAQNNQVLWNRRKLHDAFVRQIRNVFDSRDRRNGWPCPDINKNFVALQSLAIYHKLVRRYKASLSANQADRRPFLDLLLLP